MNKRGRRAADAMGRFLAEHGPLPSRVLCSTAERTRETWERMQPALAAAGARPEVEVERELYLASGATLLARIQACAAEPCLLLVAHNPGTQDLARTLAGHGDEEGWHRMRSKFPTAGLATLGFAAERWSAIRPGAGELLRFVAPRDLDDGRRAE